MQKNEGVVEILARKHGILLVRSDRSKRFSQSLGQTTPSTHTTLSPSEKKLDLFRQRSNFSTSFQLAAPAIGAQPIQLQEVKTQQNPDRKGDFGVSAPAFIPFSTGSLRCLLAFFCCGHSLISTFLFL